MTSDSASPDPRHDLSAHYDELIDGIPQGWVQLAYLHSSGWLVVDDDEGWRIYGPESKAVTFS